MKKSNIGFRVLSSGCVPVCHSSDGWRYLLLRSFSYWDFPKGEVGAGEDPLLAAKRELLEETQLSDVSFRFGEEFYETQVYSKGKIARYYLCEVKDASRVKLLPNPLTGIQEHHEFRWVSHPDAGHLLGDRVRAALDWAHHRLLKEENS